MSGTKSGSAGGNYRACRDSVFLVSERWVLLCDHSQALTNWTPLLSGSIT